MNGIDLDQWNDMVDSIRSHPQAGTVTLRTRHQWDDGLAVDGHAKEIEASAEVATRKFTFRTDWPTDVGGADSGPTPGEVILAALGGCVGMTYIAQAATRGVAVDQLEVAIEAKVDIRGLFELDKVRAGLSAVAINLKVRSDADDATLNDLGQTTTRTSAVYDSLAHPVPMCLTVQRLP